MESSPRSIDGDTAGWLTDQLRASRAIGADAQVVGHTWEALEVQGGASATTRVRLEYEGGDGPSTLIVKVATSNAAMRELAVQRGVFQREVRFYQHFAAALGEVVPRCHAAEINEAGDEFVLLLEDLSAGRVGDRIGFSVRDAEMAVDGAAALHGGFWEDRSLARHAWLRTPDDELNPEGLRFGKLALNQSADACESRFGDAVPSVVTEATRMLAGRLEAFHRHRAGRPLTLIHGDYHPGQLFFPSEAGGRVVISDWQTARLGTGAEDVGRVLVTGFSVEERRAIEPELLDRYYEALLRHGVDGYSRAEFAEDYRLAMYLSLIMTVASVPRLSDEYLAERRERSLRLGGDDPVEGIFSALAGAMEDHDFIGAIAALPG
jgi:ecdysteroid kinase